MKPVTDPALLTLLNEDHGIGGHFAPVNNPAVLAQLNGTQAPHDDFGIQPVQGDFANRLRDMVIGSNQAVVGAGRGMTELGQGVKQLGLHVGGAIGSATPQEVADYDRQIADEAELYNRDVGQTLPGKIGEFAGQAVATLPVGGLGAGIATKAGAGIGNVLMNAMRVGAKGALQGGVISAAQPVTDVAQPASLADLVHRSEPQGENYLTAKLGQTALGSAIGAGGNVVLRGLGAAAEAAMNAKTLPFRARAGAAVNEAVNKKPSPKTIDLGTPGGLDEAQSTVQEASKATPADHVRDHIAEAEQLQRGIPGLVLTPGQQTGSKGLLTLEQKARQSSSTADRVFGLDKNATQALDDHISKVISNVSKNAANAEDTGNLVRTALNGKIKSLDAARRTQAAADYGAVRQASGGQPIIQPDNLRAALSDLKAEFGGGATKTAKAFNRFADDIGNSDVGNVDKLLQLRRQMSRVAGGQEAISGDGYDSKAARDILAAIDNDLDASAERLGGTNVGELLKTANANYRAASQQIDYIKQSPLGKLLGKEVTNGSESFNTVQPEKIVARLKAMEPSDVSTTRALMQDVSPDVWQATKASLINDALEQARNTSVSKGANPLAMQPGEFVRALYGGATAKAQTHGQAWAKALFEPGELQEIQKVISAAKRLGDMTGYNFSGTAAQLEADPTLLGALGSAAKGNFGTAAGKVAGSVGKLLTANRLAVAMADPNGRKILLQLERLPPGAAKARELTARLAALAPAVGMPHEKQDRENQPANE